MYISNNDWTANVKVNKVC